MLNLRRPIVLYSVGTLAVGTPTFRAIDTNSSAGA
jgi:hypothetical protein